MEHEAPKNDSAYSPTSEATQKSCGRSTPLIRPKNAVRPPVEPAPRLEVGPFAIFPLRSEKIDNLPRKNYSR
jgi:hypothetical protein